MGDRARECFQCLGVYHVLATNNIGFMSSYFFGLKVYIYIYILEIIKTFS